MLTASVVVSCYNQEQYIGECLDSILAQSISFECEIIVSDDCSTDQTQNILKAYKEKYSDKIKLHLREQNVGAAVNYIDLHNLAQGDIVYHFDGDDIMLPGKLQNQYDVFVRDADVNVVFHNAVYFSDDSTYCSRTNFSIVKDKEYSCFSLDELARWGTIAVHGSYAYRRSSRKTKYLNREFMEWFFAMDSLIPSGKGVFLREPYIKYRCNPMGNSYLSTRTGQLKAYRIYLEDLLIIFNSTPHLRKDLYVNFIVTFLSMIKTTRSFQAKYLFFLLRNSLYFRPSKLIDTIKVRLTVGPALKVR